MNIFALIEEQIPLVEVVSRYINLEKSGTYLRGSCPLSQEEGRSFTVSSCGKRFYCFECHQGGDVIVFLSKKENLSPREAVKALMIQGGLIGENTMTIL